MHPYLPPKMLDPLVVHGRATQNWPEYVGLTPPHVRSYRVILRCKIRPHLERTIISANDICICIVYGGLLFIHCNTSPQHKMCSSIYAHVNLTPHFANLSYVAHMKSEWTHVKTSSATKTIKHKNIDQECLTIHVPYDHGLCDGVLPPSQPAKLSPLHMFRVHYIQSIPNHLSADPQSWQSKFALHSTDTLVHSGSHNWNYFANGYYDVSCGHIGSIINPPPSQQLQPPPKNITTHS